MRTVRGLLIVAVIIALIALTISSAGLLAFDLFAPLLFVFAAMFDRAFSTYQPRPLSAAFHASTALRAPPTR